MNSEQIEALETELYGMDFKDEPWTQEDLDRQAEIMRLLAENGAAR